jgi:hypothetical protein
MNIKKMCTSIAFGFYIRDEESFIEFKEKVIAISLMEDSLFGVLE